MRSSHIVTSVVGGLLVMLFACSPPGGDAGDGADAPDGAATIDDVTITKDAGAKDAKPAPTTHHDSGIPALVGGNGSDHCATATPVQLSASNRRMDLMASTAAATHDINAPCASDPSPDVFYKLAFSKRVFVYADTFGASWNTVLFLLSDSCVPIATSTTSGDAVCNDDACGTQQSQIVAVLEPGFYRLGLSGRAGAKGAATIHFEWALAGSGAIAQLPQGSTVQNGTTVGSGGNIDSQSADCLAAGAENSYWWAACPSDPGGTLSASTCGGAAFESVLEVQIPKSVPYQCNLDGCGLQANLTTAVPAGAGLGVLSVDGQGGDDVGAYALTVTRP